VLALDLATFQTTAHAVVQRPQCPTCGDPGQMAAVGERPIELAPIEKAHVEDGGYRRQPPRRTYERYRHLVSPITGAVTHLVAMPERDTELRAVYASGYLVCPRGGVPHTNVFDRPCAGKGRSADQARVSALCEALERYSGVYQGDEAKVRASQRELGAAALGPGELHDFSEAQYRTRAAHNARETDTRRRVPEPLDATTPIDWTPAWSLGKRERRYVPLTYCYAEAPAESGTAFSGPCSNGVAAGTCLEEAVLQGLLELVERDAAAVWWYNRLARPAVDLDSFADPYFDALRADYARLGWTVWVLDLTHDLGIATCVALAHEPRVDRFAIGFGCHLEPRLAVQRALTELNQLFDPTGTRRAPWELDRLPDRAYLFPHPDLPPVAAQGLPRIRGADLRADIEQCRARLDEAGLDLVVVDKTRPDLGLHVAQVIAPGLRHFWPRFGPGRLYQVPCTLGWLPGPLAESELNSVPLFV
jgi:thiazole/oxazole-forming peptide maturase SagD family component